MRKEKREIIIRSARLKDVDTLVNWWASGEVMAHAGFPNGIKTDKQKIMKDIIKCQESEYPRFERLMITLKPDFDIGEMSYRLTKPNTYEIGIKICDFSLHGKGYGAIAVHLLLDYLFNECHAENVVLDTNLNNIGAQRFYERLGFVKVGIRVDSWTNQLGVLQSAVDYEMTKENFYSIE